MIIWLMKHYAWVKHNYLLMSRTLQIYFSQMKLSYLALLYPMDSSTLTLQVGPFPVEGRMSGLF